MLKEYVCGHCVGKGKVPSENEESLAWVPCPLCAEKNLPPRVVLPFEGPPATSELVIETVSQHPVDEQIVLRPTGTTAQ